MLISGEIELTGLRYTEEVAWERELLQLRTRSLQPDVAPGPRDTSLDVHLVGRQDLKVQNNLVQGALALDMDVSGTIEQPKLDGLIELESGSLFYFRGQVYRLRRGLAQFSEGGRKPYLDIEAEAQVERQRPGSAQSARESFRILLTIIGPTDALRVHFDSDPPLPEVDILTLLSFGVLAEDLGNAGATAGLEISSFLLSNQISQVEREIQSMVGFDRLEIAPAFGDTGNNTMQLRLEKRLAERISLSLSSGLDSAAEQRVEIGYRVGRGVDMSLGWNTLPERSSGNFFARPRLVVPIP
jgi:autotransporter translocation and assembly factor TamB